MIVEKDLSEQSLIIAASTLWLLNSRWELIKDSKYKNYD